MLFFSIAGRQGARRSHTYPKTLWCETIHGRGDDSSTATRQEEFVES